MSGVNFNDTDTKPFSNVFIQTTNGTDTTSNLNFGTYTAIPMFTAEDGVSTYDSEFTIDSTTQITVNFDGVIQAMANVSQTSAGQRVSLTPSFFQNSAQVGPTGSASYIRNSNGTDESGSAILPFFLSVSNGDTLDIRMVRVSTLTNTTSFTSANSSYATIIRIA